MRRHSLIWSIRAGLGLLLLFSACTSKFQDMELSRIHIQVAEPDTKTINADIVFGKVLQEVQKLLPNAYFQGLVFGGGCQDLPQLKGKLVFDFVEVREGILRQQVIRGTATVDTRNEMMDLSVGDVSDFYPSLERAEFLGNSSIKDVAGLAYQHIQELGDCVGEVTLTQLADRWDVRCGPLENFIQRCHFEIVNGQIKDLQN